MASVASPPSRVRRTIVTILKIGLYGGLLALIALIVAVGVAMSSLPSYQELIRRDDLGQTIRVRAADGSVILSSGPSFGNWLRYDEIPDIMKKAMVAVEDKRFRSHPGVDPIGTARAFKVRAEKGRWTQGGSTITQQLARNIFLTNSRTFGRKVREAVLALALERRFSKDQILELYLNRVYFGGGAYGIDAASRKFFGHDAKTLSLSEAAIIAGLVKAPSNYAPSADAEAARSRAEVVIRLMQENGDISAAAATTAEPAEVRIVPTATPNSMRYFTDWVLPQLDTLIDETVEPIEVWTTLDPNMQRHGDQVINAATPAGAQGALIALDRDGSVRAMVGGRDYVRSLYNRGTQANRQPGSAFKLFVYLAAIEAGYKPDDLVSDEPIKINGWSPRNNNRTFAGQVPLRQAFAQSINTVSVRLAQEVGFRTVADMAQRFGITTPVVTHPSMALGSSEVRLLDMTRAFAAVSAKGNAVVPYGIKRVTTADGAILYQHPPAEGRVLVAPWVAAQMTDLLQAAVLTGTARAAQIGRPVAGKTGTTSSNKDGWFLGFSSGLTTGVWMGRDDNKAIPGLQGGRAPARAFHDFMARAVANRPAEAFEIAVQTPEWAITEPDEETWFEAPDNGAFVNPDGSGPAGTLPPPPPPMRDEDVRRFPDEREEDRLDQEFIDRATDRVRPEPPRRRDRDAPRPLERESDRDADPMEDRAMASEP
ncbi:MAG TPA: PBP1A family penicillin-binding protein [Allosphingosinicella sp.]|jgi:penicillin-binding protein 1A